MTTQTTNEAEDVSGPDSSAISPLPGEPGIPDVASRQGHTLSKKGLLAVALLLTSLTAVLGFTIQRATTSGKRNDAGAPTQVRDKPSAATTEPRKLDMTSEPAASAAPRALPRIPALAPTADELAEPIGVRRTGAGAPPSTDARTPRPEDAPVLLVAARPGAAGGQGPASARPGSADSLPETSVETPSHAKDDPLAATARNLQGYQRQLHGLMDTLTRSTALAAGPGTQPPPPGALLSGLPVHGRGPGNGESPTSNGLFGGQLQGSAAQPVQASMLGNRSLTLPKGTAFTCALKTKVISAASGLVGCQVQRNVYGDDGRVLLVERGSHLDGEYRITSVRPGTVSIPVLWTRIRTPLGVTVDVDSPGTGQLGESGIDGHVDNRWVERIGAATLLSLIDDSVKLVIQNQTGDRPADTIVLPSTTGNSSKLAEKVLESTINIPPLIYQNQGGIVGIYVARDVDFSTVYELRPTATTPAREGSP